MSCYLSTAYWAPIQYYSKIYSFDNIFIEKFETYPKQTYRNRCKIYGPNGVQSLQVPVEKGSFHKTIIKDLTIDYSTDWQKNHLKTIESAYRSSPFYEFYIDDIIPVYEKKFDFLIELNEHLLTITFNWLDFTKQHTFTSEFDAAPMGFDYRDTIHPKKNKNKTDDSFKQALYMQGFEQRHGFVPNLSILDLVFNTGPEATSIIKNSTK